MYKSTPSCPSMSMSIAIPIFLSPSISLPTYLSAHLLSSVLFTKNPSSLCPPTKKPKKSQTALPST
ncbi:hypothetical protein K491DRAFT_692868 [Lophiostoma macrostomum CBS 122681]|uniref:Uncharacterized protein n=1 Tax=Lophiostoma macrostomum CBS 122681 TaxID=1314788 RepID=A0A6A6T9C2_9PLEO|nr:hypothetical protein K491DRAFT_692868 [Lophiostoma macrostomum CBS 122681]